MALVTGAGMGMGLATAQAFAEAGAAVVLADISEDAVHAAAELVAAGHQAIGVRCNVADEADVAAMIEQTVSKFGRLDAAFNNAGIMTPSVEAADVSSEEYERVMGVNLRGVWNCMKYELRQMREQGSGAIVNNSSIAGVAGAPTRAIYSASKFGVIGLTQSTALEYAAKGILIGRHTVAVGLDLHLRVGGQLDQPAGAAIVIGPRQGPQVGPFDLPGHSNAFWLPLNPTLVIGQTGLSQLLVQALEAVRLWQRDHKVPAGVTNTVFDPIQNPKTG